MPSYSQGNVNPYQIASVIPNEVFGIAINWFAPRTPLLARLPKVPDGSPVFQMVGHTYRPRSTKLNAAVADNTNTTINLLDNSFIMTGDILALASGEYVEVVSDPSTSNTTVTVRRGIGGTTAAAQTNATAVVLVGNSRTGGEDSPKSISSSLSTATQVMQTIQHPYSVGGGVQSNTLYPLQPGASTPLEGYKMDAMQNCVDDAEYSAYYGVLEQASSSISRPKMAGLSSIIQTNKVTSPVSASAYKASDFQRDLLTGPRKTGGAPNMVFVSSNWMDAFATWSIPLQRIDQGETIFGRPLRSYSCAFLGDVEIVEASLLPNFTAFSLTADEVRWRVKRPMIDEPYAKSGDVSKGHILVELAIEVDNEFHHGWLQGVTAFSS